MNTSNKTIVISGIARGIGKALALEAADQGWQVAGLDIRQDDLDTLSEELNQFKQAHYLEVVDIRDAEACEAFIQKVVKALGSIHVLINNAGITHIAPEDKTSIEASKNLMDINFMGTVHLSHFALPHIIASKGCLAGVSSVAGYSPLLYRTAYAASKHAVWGYLSSLRSEMREKKVQVLTICPSFVSTDLQENQQKYFKNSTNEALTTQYVAQRILEAIEQRDDLCLIGKTAKRVYWLNRFFPKLYEKIMIKKMKM